MKKIIIVEDDELIRDELKSLLESSNYEVIACSSFENVADFILSNEADLVLLDINIPYINGEEVLKEIRKRSNLPVIMVTSRNNEIDEALSISYGADDYIVKPYNPNILLLRIENIFKRINRIDTNLKYHNMIINQARCELVHENIRVELTKNEMIIFMALFNKINSIVTRDEIMTLLWNNDEYINDNALTVNISRLRKKLEDAGLKNAIETKKGLGYILS